MSLEMLSRFTGVEFFKQTAPFMGTRVPYNANFPLIWDQNKLQQEPKWEGTPLGAFGATHGATSRDELERKMAEYGGTRIPGKDVLALAKGIGKDWKGDYVTKPKLELQHYDSSEHVTFETFLAQPQGVLSVQVDVCAEGNIAKRSEPQFEMGTQTRTYAVSKHAKRARKIPGTNTAPSRWKPSK